ncbi:MAG: NADH-quinone oxidoreductase subunit I [Nitrospinae bacterium]|nr:NADH-quinone oxidoreductase subunit I [Nitrospinota bacterium]
MTEYFANVYSGVSTVLVGMGLTFRHLFTPAVTLQYPEKKNALPIGARAQLFNNIDDCIGCGFCVKVCPVDCIYMETVKVGPGEDLGKASLGNPKRLHVLRFDIDMAKCCYCDLCTIPCPTECLQMTPKYESSVYARANLLYHFATYPPEDTARIRAEGARREAAEAEKRKAAAAARAAGAKTTPKEGATKLATAAKETATEPAE